MNFKNFFKLIFKTGLSALFLIVFSVPSFSEEDVQINYLHRIIIEKPVDNSYQLNLYFKDKFNGNAFVQRVKNGVYSVFIPDTAAAAKNIKVIYKGKVKPADVKIKINEFPYSNGASKCVKLLTETPVNSDIELTAQTYTPNVKNSIKIGGQFMSISAIIAAVLLAASATLLVSICKAVKSMNGAPQNYTSFPAGFIKAPEEYAAKADEDKLASEYQAPSSRPAKPRSAGTTGRDIGCIGAERSFQQTAERIQKKEVSNPAADDFGCFDLKPIETEEQKLSLNSAEPKIIEREPEEKTQRLKTASNPVKQSVQQSEDASGLLIASVEDSISENDDDIYRPELISELTIGANKGFYLTALNNGTYALFGYAGGNISFLQKFKSKPQNNLQARFYDRKYGKDVYIVSLDSYRAAVSVSDTDIVELAAV